MFVHSMPNWNILRTSGIFYGHLLSAIFGKFVPVLVHCIKKNLATLNAIRNESIGWPPKLP
jgi:hypothetical protein